MSSEWPDSWQVMPLQDAMEAIIDYRGKTPQKSESGIPLITAKIVKNGRIEKPSEFITEELYDDWMVRGLPEIGDVVVTTEAPLGEVAQLSDSNVALAQRIVTLRGKNGLLDNDFLLFLMQSKFIQEQLEARASGSTVKGIKQSELRKVSLPVPPIDEQMKIARHLKALDDKIERNRQINQTLEQIAHTIFKSWFVDFEPVKAKIEAKAAGRDPERAAMCAISGKLEPELYQLSPEQYQQLAATAALFPDELVESELGGIPEGWEVKSIADISQFATGKIDVSALSLENYISTENMLENKGGVSTATSLPTVSTVSSFSKGQVLISNIRPYFKKIWLARFAGGRSNDVLAFNAIEYDCREFLYNLLYQDDFFEFMMRTSKGAKMPRGDKDAIAGWKFPCADRKLRSFFSEKVRPYYSYIESLNAEVQQLSLIRDTLLPKLLSGELSVENLPLEATA